jgi:hypothetical protein
VLEVTFHTLTTERVFGLRQNDRADDFMTGDLRSQKHFAVRNLRVGEFHKLTVWIHLFPFVLHLFESNSGFCFRLAGGQVLGPRRAAAMFYLVMFQGGSRYFASATSGSYSQMS